MVCLAHYWQGVLKGGESWRLQQGGCSMPEARLETQQPHRLQPSHPSVTGLDTVTSSRDPGVQEANGLRVAGSRRPMITEHRDRRGP
jgi:hypothetical protein